MIINATIGALNKPPDQSAVGSADIIRLYIPMNTLASTAIESGVFPPFRTTRSIARQIAPARTLNSPTPKYEKSAHASPMNMAVVVEPFVPLHNCETDSND